MWLLCRVGSSFRASKFQACILKTSLHHSLPLTFPCGLSLPVDPAAGVRAVARGRVPRVPVLVAVGGPEGQRGELHLDALGGGEGKGNRNTLGPGHSGEKRNYVKT